MFNKSTAPENRSITVIGKNTFFKGEIVANTDCVRVDGILEGTLSAKKKVVVTSSGIVKGSIRSSYLENKGVVEGIISTKDETHLTLGSHTNAEITTDTFAMEEGAHFEGKIKMPNIKKFAKGNSYITANRRKVG